MKHIPGMEEVMDRFYRFELNIGMQSFFDAAWHAWVGDGANGIKAESDWLRTFEVAPWFTAWADANGVPP